MVKLSRRLAFVFLLLVSIPFRPADGQTPAANGDEPGLEKQIDPQAMADLLAYLESLPRSKTARS